MSATQGAFVAPVLPTLRSELDDLPAQARRVADVILADPREASGLPIQELARRAGTSEASVTRLAQRVGRRGFPELRIALASESATATATASRVVGDVALDDPLADVRAKMLADLERSLADTSSSLDDATIDRVARAVVEARRVVVVGIAASGIVADDLAQKLERLGVAAVAVTEYHRAMTTSVGVIAGDVVIGVSHSGETIDVIEPLAAASEAGATTVAITSAARSTLARACDHVLRTVAGTDNAFRPAAMSSRAAQLFVVDVLFVAVVQRDHDRVAPHLAKSWQAVSGRHLDRRGER